MLETNSIVIYPNPGTDIINIVSRKNVNIEVYDLLGNLLIVKDNVTKLDISSLPAGIYNFVILYDSVKISKKVVKQWKSY